MRCNHIKDRFAGETFCVNCMTLFTENFNKDSKEYNWQKMFKEKEENRINNKPIDSYCNVCYKNIGTASGTMCQDCYGLYNF